MTTQTIPVQDLVKLSIAELKDRTKENLKRKSDYIRRLSKEEDERILSCLDLSKNDLENILPRIFPEASSAKKNMTREAKLLEMIALFRRHPDRRLPEDFSAKKKTPRKTATKAPPPPPPPSDDEETTTEQPLGKGDGGGASMKLAQSSFATMLQKEASQRDDGGYEETKSSSIAENVEPLPVQEMSFPKTFTSLHDLLEDQVSVESLKKDEAFVKRSKEFKEKRNQAILSLLGFSGSLTL